MHLIDFQYLKEITTNQKGTDMHDLYSIYAKVEKCITKSLKQYLVDGKNVRFYPHQPKMSDIEIISLSITSECLGIDSENLLFAKIKKDYSVKFPNLVHRTRYNFRSKTLRKWISYCADIWSEELTGSEDAFIVDSIPIPVCKICRAPRSTVCRKDGDDVKASKGFDSTISQYFVGYRLHLIASVAGVYQHCALLPANVHDINFLKQLEQTHLFDCTLIGYRAYRSNPLQLDLFEGWVIQLSVPYRINQKDYQKYPCERKIQRKRIETLFSQYCDDFMLKRNYAKSHSGLEVRIYSKIAGMTFKQYWNYPNGNKISKTKHSLAA
jgi:Transposase DDE domain